MKQIIRRWAPGLAIIRAVIPAAIFIMSELRDVLSLYPEPASMAESEWSMP